MVYLVWGREESSRLAVEMQSISHGILVFQRWWYIGKGKRKWQMLTRRVEGPVKDSARRDNSQRRVTGTAH